MTVYEMTLTLRIEIINENETLDTPQEWIENIIEGLQDDAEGLAHITGDGTIKEVKQ